MNKINDRIINRIQKLSAIGLLQDEIAYELRISQTTVNKYLKKKGGNCERQKRSRTRS